MSVIPGMGLVEHQPQERNVVAAKTSGLFSDIAVAVKSRGGNAVPNDGPRPFSPNADLQQAHTNFMERFCHDVSQEFG